MEDNKKLIGTSSFWANFFKAPTEKSDLETVLSSMPPFKHIGVKYIHILMKLVHNRVFAANENIFYQGDPGIGLYIIREGEVRISQDLENGYQLELARFHRGDFFGELALLDEEFRSASAIALKDSKLAVIFKPDLDEFIEKYPKQGIQILRGISQIITTRLRKLNDDFVALYSKSIDNSKESQNEHN